MRYINLHQAYLDKKVIILSLNLKILTVSQKVVSNLKLSS